MICQDGICVPPRNIATDYIELATEDLYSTLMIVTGDTLVWGQPAFPPWHLSVPSPQTINRVATDGGTSVELARLTYAPVGIAADATTIYWTSYDTVADSGVIQSMPIDGGAQDVLATTPAGYPTAIAVNATRAYWLEQPADPSQPGSLRVMTSPVMGGGPVELARSSEVNFPYLEPIKVYALVFDASGVYWTNTVDGTIEVVPTDGGSSKVVARGADTPSGSLAVAANRVFFVGTGGLQMVDLASGELITVAPDASWRETVAADDRYVYFVVRQSDSDNKLWRAPFDGGTSELIAADMPPIWSVAIDDASIFLNVEACGPKLGRILRLKKP